MKKSNIILVNFLAAIILLTGFKYNDIQDEGCPCGGFKVLPPGSYKCVGEKRQKCMLNDQTKQYSWFQTSEYCHEDDPRCTR
jgi:hypothetical protein